MVTLEQIKAKHSEIGEMISKFEEIENSVIVIPRIEINLAPGERYAGAILNGQGNITHHLILLQEEAESVNWKDAQEWAKKVGGELPSPQEQSLLYANLKDQFQSAWYWSNAQHATEGGCAWCQYFGDGTQDNFNVIIKLRARAVRRLVFNN